jgi:hypothetical protein
MMTALSLFFIFSEEQERNMTEKQERAKLRRKEARQMKIKATRTKRPKAAKRTRTVHTGVTEDYLHEKLKKYCFFIVSYT